MLKILKFSQSFWDSKRRSKEFHRTLKYRLQHMTHAHKLLIRKFLKEASNSWIRPSLRDLTHCFIVPSIFVGCPLICAVKMSILARAWEYHWQLECSCLDEGQLPTSTLNCTSKVSWVPTLGNLPSCWDFVGRSRLETPCEPTLT